MQSILSKAIQAAQEHQRPKGVLRADQAQELVTIDSFTGVRAKGSMRNAIG